MKQIILTVLLAFYVLTAFGQKHVRLSFTGSPSINWMTTSNSHASNEKLILGYNFGLNGDFYFSEDERYSILTGVQITNAGGEISYNPGYSFQFANTTLPSPAKIKYLLRYIEVPFAVRLRTDEFNRVRYWGLFGLSGMVNIEARGTSNDGSLKKANINSEVNLFNMAMNLGIGIDYDLGSSNAVSLGLVFQNGLLDVTTDHAFADNTKINTLNLKFGIIF
jgi:hypothetical protein